ncbi:MAG: SMC-Scp complex subunit ScpB [Fimbriimonadaceae bacterium]
MRLIDKVHALLFVADSPATVEEIAQALEIPEFEIEAALEQLGGKLTGEGPVQLVRIAGGYQVCTKPDYAEPVAKFLKPQAHKLTRSVMEVLAIVAYKQPITMPEIDAIRGVQSDYGLGQLVEKRLVAEVGRKNSPGRPVLYGTTQQFLHLFNLDKLDDLPDVKIEVEAGLAVPQEELALVEGE